MPQLAEAVGPLMFLTMMGFLLVLSAVASFSLGVRCWATSADGPFNRLVHEASPYLRQHADNPVDWYPWGEEALTRAKREDKPILLSIGYSSCHWCHVMEHESFEDPVIARLMNEHFVCIKVDREERPDLDHVYMTAVQMMTGQGGWPLNVFLTPDLKPFFGGTYFPPEPRYGRVSWPHLLQRVAQLYRTDRNKIEKSAGELMAYLRQAAGGVGAGEAPTAQWVSRAARQLKRMHDPVQGGLGSAPKFPQPGALDLMLREYLRSRGRDDLQAVVLTLRKMAVGGMYDQLAGGFHRYSVDERWLVPHFEKMLYDNALLPPVYLAAWQVTGDAFFARIARETLDYVVREMTSPEGAFYTATDADSEGKEGVYFIWNPPQIRDVLNDEELAQVMMARYGVTEEGNFEGGMTVLHLAASPEEIARQKNMPVEKVEQMLAEGRRRLLEARQRRVPPFRDEKILTSWNGLMISAFTQAAAALDEPRYGEAAQRAVDFIRSAMLEGDTLYHVYKEGIRRGAGDLLEDYAFFSQALLDLFQVTFDRGLLELADRLVRVAIERFQDTEVGGFYLATERPDLPVRPRSAFDASLPSPASAMAFSLARLDLLLDRPDYREIAAGLFKVHAAEMQQSPIGTAHLLRALDFVTSPPRQIVMVASRNDPTARAWARQIRQRYLPDTVLFWCDPADWPAHERPPILQGREPVDGKATVFICQNFTCSLPVTEGEELEAQLRSNDVGCRPPQQDGTV